MVIMTDALKSLAGDTIRSALMRFTRSPTSGAITGACCTAILQSSSATTVAAVGFVSAELLSFSAALGIIFGANIGTTVTGWMIALLGFKLQLSTIVLPLILIGAILKLFSNGRWAQWGLVLAGFGLIFVGISVLQQGMSELQNIISFDNLPTDSISGLLLLVGIGFVFTVITQSSSAGVATTLTALFSGLISFEQAAALIIGMDVGTTVTAAMATIGGSVGAKRTGFSHVLYNCFTGLGALFLITPYVWTWETLAPGQLEQNSEIGLVAFHTLFNLIGVMLILPFTRQFARLIQTIIPEKKNIYLHKLDEALLEQPGLALNAVHGSIRIELIALLKHLQGLLEGGESDKLIDLPKMQHALDQTHTFIDKIHLAPGDYADWQRLIALIHTLDHMQRLHERLEEEEYRVVAARKTLELKTEYQLLTETINALIKSIENMAWQQAQQQSNKTVEHMEAAAQALRQSIMAKVGSGEIDVPEGTSRVEAIRWIRRVSRHIARICDRLHEATQAAGK